MADGKTLGYHILLHLGTKDGVVTEKNEFVSTKVLARLRFFIKNVYYEVRDMGNSVKDTHLLSGYYVRKYKKGSKVAVSRISDTKRFWNIAVRDWKCWI